MAAANLITRFECKLDETHTRMDAHLDSLAAKLEARNFKMDAQVQSLAAKLEAQEIALAGQNSKLIWMQWGLGMWAGAVLSLLAFLLTQPWVQY